MGETQEKSVWPTTRGVSSRGWPGHLMAGSRSDKKPRISPPIITTPPSFTGKSSRCRRHTETSAGGVARPALSVSVATVYPGSTNGSHRPFGIHPLRSELDGKYGTLPMWCRPPTLCGKVPRRPRLMPLDPPRSNSPAAPVGRPKPSPPLVLDFSEIEGITAHPPSIAPS